MRKRLLALLMIFVIAAAAGCGSMKSETSSADRAMQSQTVNSFEGAENQNGAASVEFTKGEADSGSTEAPAAGPTVDSVTISGAEVQSAANAILAQRKIIRNANVSVEVEDFDKAYGQIKSMITSCGYVQESTIRKEKEYANSEVRFLTRGVVIIRVDKDKFDSVLDGIRGMGTLLDMNIKSDDVTDKFYDTESQLRLLKYEQDRLEKYLLKVENPDTIFKTESRLTEIRHQIESLTGTLNKMSDLVQLSTITININEKGSEVLPIKEKGYWERLFEGFTGSARWVGTFFAELLIVIAQAIPVLVLLGYITAAAVAVYRKFKKRAKGLKEEKEDK